jgi:hypothetical protein
MSYLVAFETSRWIPGSSPPRRWSRVVIWWRLAPLHPLIISSRTIEVAGWPVSTVPSSEILWIRDLWSVIRNSRSIRRKSLRIQYWTISSKMRSCTMVTRNLSFDKLLGHEFTLVGRLWLLLCSFQVLSLSPGHLGFVVAGVHHVSRSLVPFLCDSFASLIIVQKFS